MSKHTDFGRLRSADAAPRRGARGRAPLFTDVNAPADHTATSPPADSRPAAPAARRRTGEWVTLDCSGCGERSHLDLLGWMRASTPSLHLLWWGGDYPSYLRCPACRAHRWVSVSVHFGRGSGR